MKVLYSCLSKSWGGMEMFTLTAIKQLMKRGIYVELLCIGESRIHIEAKRIGLMIHTLSSIGYFHPVSIMRTASVINKGKFDIIHTQFSKDLWMLVPALNLLNAKTPLYLTKQMNSFIVKKDLLHRKLYERVTKVFAISTAVRTNLFDSCPLKPDQVELLHNGIDINKFDPDKVDRNIVRKELKLEEDEIVIGMIARFSPGKGHEEFLNAANDLNKKYKNLKFLIIGEASLGEDQYANTIKKMPIELEMPNVQFLGFRTDTPEVISAMDIFVFPSHSEAFGIALVEALAMKVPSVCSNAEGVLDIAVDKETSLLFEVKNYRSLAEKLSILIEDGGLRKRLGEGSRKRVLQHFDLEVLTDKVISFYNKSI